MQVITVVHKYSRKATECSVWVVEGAGKMTSIEVTDSITNGSIKRIFCAHPLTEPDRAEVIANVWRRALMSGGTEDLILKAHEEGY